MERLDSLLSEPLRNAMPADLVRYRLLVGAACFLVVFNALYTLGAAGSGLPPYPGIAATLLYVGVLILARSSTTAEPPAALLLTSMMFAVIAVAVEGRAPYVSTHAICTLVPIFAVYLAGARVGLFITLFLLAVLCLGYPLYFSLKGLSPPRPSPSLFWLMHLFSGLSLIEGRLIAANAAAKQFHLHRFGQEPVVGQPFWEEDSARSRLWAPHVARVYAGQRSRLEDEFELQGTRRLMDISLSPLQAASFEELGIRLERDYAPVPPISMDRHKLLQILANLLSNARQALIESPREDKRLIIGIRPEPDSNRVLIQVTDNGVGIAPENLQRLFTQGFTTTLELPLVEESTS